MSGDFEIGAWDGSPVTTCDKADCGKSPVLHAEFTVRIEGEGYASEADLCVDHLDQMLISARQVLVLNRIVEPCDQKERDILALVAEHLP